MVLTIISRTALQAKSLKKKFPKAVIGLSGYIIDNFSSYAALGLRTSIIEKHFIDTKKRNRPDVPASKDESEFKNLLKASDKIFQNLKDKKSKKPLREEKLTMKFAFASVVSIKNIKKGKKFKKKYLG